MRCGIDLGTTYSSISYYDSFANRVETIELNHADGSKVLRSVVFFPGAGQAPVVGETAWNAARQFPDRVVVGIKRAMGSAYKTQPIDGVEYTPEQVSAEILKTLAADAQEVLGEPVKEVVITVPAYFGDNEREATRRAGEMAGLTVLDILPEPHAAALAFAIEKVTDIMDRRLLVYDLGGGTFDVTLIHATTRPGANNGLSLDVRTLCKDGNASLGGLDWDKVLAEIVDEKAQQEHGVSPRLDPKFDPILMDNCEKAKRHLSRTQSVAIVATPDGKQVTVTADEFEERTRDLVLATEMLLARVLEDAEKTEQIPRDKIDVMLTGGSSKMPMCRKMIERVTGRPPVQHGNPELLVTIGAAYWAHLLQEAAVPRPVPTPGGGVEQKPVTVKPGGLSDISAYAIGVEIRRGNDRVNTVVVPKGAEYGKVFEREFGRSDDDITEIIFDLLKGDATDPGQCEKLMTVTICDLPAGGKKGDKVRVKLGYDQSGIIKGEALDLASGKKVDLEVDRSKI